MGHSFQLEETPTSQRRANTSIKPQVTQVTMQEVPIACGAASAQSMCSLACLHSVLYITRHQTTHSIQDISHSICIIDMAISLT